MKSLTHILQIMLIVFYVYYLSCCWLEIIVSDLCPIWDIANFSFVRCWISEQKFGGFQQVCFLAKHIRNVSIICASNPFRRGGTGVSNPLWRIMFSSHASSSSTFDAREQVKSLKEAGCDAESASHPASGRFLELKGNFAARWRVHTIVYTSVSWISFTYCLRKTSKGAFLLSIISFTRAVIPMISSTIFIIRKFCTRLVQFEIRSAFLALHIRSP
jgi:hypothetical protein